MRPTVLVIGLSAATALACLSAGPAASAPTAQSRHCADTAKEQGLSGAARARFIATCKKGPLAPSTPTAPTASSSKEARAITKPSGVDRTTRAKQCAAEADRKDLAAKDRKAFQLSCLATAGPVSEGETGTVQPRPGNQIKGIGENNYKPSSTGAKSTPDRTPPAAAKPKS